MNRGLPACRVVISSSTESVTAALATPSSHIVHAVMFLVLGNNFKRPPRSPERGFLPGDSRQDARSRLIFHVFAALAEFERDLIRERTQAGLVAARARGRVGGRPTVWTSEKLRTAGAMHASGDHDVASIARVLGVSRASVYRALERFKASA